MLPRISLVMPSYNQAAFLEAALQSVLAQNYPQLELIVMDGGSTDGSVELLRRYEQGLTYWTSGRDAGQSDALNRGFTRATGTILGWLNSDDLLLPGTLHTVGAHFAAHPECQFVTGDGAFVDEAGTRELYVIHAGAWSFRELLHYCDDMYLPQPSVFFSQRAWQASGGLDVTLQYAMDLDLWLRMRQKVELWHIPARLSLQRMHPAAKGEQWGQPALHAVAQITRRYWQKVSPFERARLALSLNHMLARGYCREGLARVLQGDRQGAREALLAAVGQDPRILVSPLCRPLLARLILPLSLRQRLLHVP